jgi:FtsP/CotA-like multicopper oxidase with cupredoxin domain
MLRTDRKQSMGCPRMLRRLYRVLIVLSLAVVAFPAHQAFADAGNPCAKLDALYPEPGRQGLGGENAYRPLPTLMPWRSAQGDPGTLSVTVHMDHVSSAPKGKPEYLFVGNYQVTDISTFRFVTGINTVAEVIDPVTGKGVPISNACLDSPDWGYTGVQLGLIQGDTLDALLVSHLDYTGTTAVERPVNGGVPCRSFNLHTHGLLVSPYHPHQAGQGLYGDYVLDTTQPKGSEDFGRNTDTCGTQLLITEHAGHGLTDYPIHIVTHIPGHPGINSLLTGEHPSGLFWYHPHPHGYSKGQLYGGTTGAVTIGELTDYACPHGDGYPHDCNLSNANVRIMSLKDSELTFYDNNQFSTIHAEESGLCTPRGGTRHGECQAVDNQPASKWLFTVNGIEFPTMHAHGKQFEIWRIINESSSMSYSLSLVPERGGPELPFQLLAKDGASIDQPEGKKITRSEILLMPASRVEIAIEAPPSGGRYLLRQNVVETGENGVGDFWPQVDLARLDWDRSGNDAVATDISAPTTATGATDPGTPAASSTPFVVAGPQTPVPPDAFAADDEPPGRCHLVSGDKRLIYFVHRFKKVYGQGNDGTGGPSGLSPSWHEVFGLIAGIQRADGTLDFYSNDGKTIFHTLMDVWKNGTQGDDPAFPALNHNNFNTVCTHRGDIEHWEFINWSGEDHNFHIHQSKFLTDPRGEFQFPHLSAYESPYIRHTDELVRAFYDLSNFTQTYNDTVPVPRGQSYCAENPDLPGCKDRATRECTGIPEAPQCVRPGKASIIMNFGRLEQVGEFVYHCHILEHEDGGMMAIVKVLCKKNDPECAAAQIAGAFCTPDGSLDD